MTSISSSLGCSSPAASSRAVKSENVAESCQAGDHCSTCSMKSAARAKFCSRRPCRLFSAVRGWSLPAEVRLVADEPMRGRLLGYRIGSIGTGIFGAVPGLLLLIFLTDTVGVPAMRRAAWFAYAGWPGYPVLTPTLQRAKSAGPLAAAWALLRQVGVEGYRSLKLAARSAPLTLAAGVSTVEGLRVRGVPDTTLLAVAGSPGLRSGGRGPGGRPGRRRRSVRSGPVHSGRGRTGPAAHRDRPHARHGGPRQRHPSTPSRSPRANLLAVFLSTLLTPPAG
jgi:hypothetical protein